MTGLWCCCTAERCSHTCTHVRSHSGSFPSRWSQNIGQSSLGQSFHTPQGAYADPKSPGHPHPQGSPLSTMDFTSQVFFFPSFFFFKSFPVTLWHWSSWARDQIRATVVTMPFPSPTVLDVGSNLHPSTPKMLPMAQWELLKNRFLIFEFLW